MSNFNECINFMQLPFALQHWTALVIYFIKKIQKAKEAVLVICFAALKNFFKT